MKRFILVLALLLFAVPVFGQEKGTIGKTYAPGTLTPITRAALPATGDVNKLWSVTDCADAACVTGGGSVKAVLKWGGSAYVAVGVPAAGDLPSGIDAAKIGGGGVSTTEYDFLGTLTSNVQTQIEAKQAAISLAASKLYGRGSAGGTGAGEEITLGTGLSISGTTLNVAGGGDILGAVGTIDNAVPKANGTGGVTLQGPSTVPTALIITDAGDVGFGTDTPIFNDDGVTGANVGKWVAIDGGASGNSGYLGIGGTVPGVTDRVGRLNFFNYSMGGVDNRTAYIDSGNEGVLGRGYLSFATAPDNVGPTERLWINYNGHFGFGKVASVGDTISVKTHGATSATSGLTIQDSATVLLFRFRDDGRFSLDKPGAAISFSGGTSGTTTVTPTAIAGTTALTLPAANDTLVGKATTDILTNKTVNGADNTLTVRLANDVSGDLPFANFTQASAASKLLGRGSAAGAGDYEEVTLGSGLTMTGTTLSAAGGGVTGTGTTGKLAKYTDGAGAVIGDSNISESGATDTINADVIVTRPAAADGSVFVRSAGGTQEFRVTANVNGPRIESTGSGAGNLTIAPATDFSSSVNTATNYKAVGVVIYSSGTPSIAGNGTLNADSKDSAGKVTTTGTGASTIVLTFANAFTRAPACSVNNETTANLARASSSTTQLTIGATIVTGDSLSYTCLGY